MARTTATIITRTSKIYVERILPPIPNGIINITPASSNNSIWAGVLAIIQRTEPVFTPVVVPVTTGAFTFLYFIRKKRFPKNIFEYSSSHFHLNLVTFVIY